MTNKINEIKARYNELCTRLSGADVMSDMTEYQKIAKESSKLGTIVETANQIDKCKHNLSSAREILARERDEDLLALARAEIADTEGQLSNLEEQLRELLIPTDPRDDSNVIIEIRPAAGGDEAGLFAAALLRMYTMYATANGFRTEINELDESEIGGLKQAVMTISGDGAYGRFKFESGVHRVQRVPDTETQGRIHTSTATVAVLPEAVTVDFKIDERDLRVDVYRSSGAGGQHVNRTESAVRLTHIPTGTVVTCQDGRSQIKNKEKAMIILQTKLADFYQSQEDAKYADTRKNQVGTGDRSERIRTYNFPQSRMTDHRIGYTSHNLPAIMDGDLADLFAALKKAAALPVT